MDASKRCNLFGFWVRRTVDHNFDKLLLTVLIGISIAISFTFRLLVMFGHPEYEQLNNGWLREQTALLIGALLGLVRGTQPEKKHDQEHPPQP